MKKTEKQAARGDRIMPILTSAALAVVFLFLGLGAIYNSPTEQPPQELTSPSGFMVGEVEDGSGLRLTYATGTVTSENEQSVLLTATMTPESAADKTVTWVASWQDSGSSWASGKTVTDYVTVTPTSEGALTATVSCVQDFGEPVVVTVSSTAVPEVSASCTFDYAARVTETTVSGGLVSSESTSEAIYLNASSMTQTATWDSTPVYSAYTEPNYFEENFTFKYGDNFVSLLADNGFTVNSANTTWNEVFDSIIDFFNGCLDPVYNGQDYLDQIRNKDGDAWTRVLNTFTALNNGPVGRLRVTYTGWYTTCVCEFNVYYPTEYLYDQAESLFLPETDYIF